MFQPNDRNITLAPEDYAAHKGGRAPFRFRHPWWWRLIKLAVFIPIWFVALILLSTLMRWQMSAVTILGIIGIALPVLTILVEMLRPLPPR